MQIKAFDSQQLIAAAQAQFPDYEIELQESDVFLKGKQAGRYRADWLDHEFYISTEYAYEDRLVNGNPTRYKIAMPCILLKKNRYEIVYDISDRYYVAYEEHGEIQFLPYQTMLETLLTQTELLEELTPV